MPLDIELVAGNRLSSDRIAAWRAMQQSNAQLANPCFSPEFVEAVAAVRKDVEVAIVFRNGVCEAFFPFQRKGSSRAVPVGGIVSDYHGIICRPDFTFDPRELLKACSLVAWDFDRLVASQASFAPFHRLCEPSAQINLPEGYEAYVAERRAAGTRQLRQCEYMARRLAREVGPVRFVAHSTDPRHLGTLLAWKSEQYRRSGWDDLFATRWGRALVEKIHTIQKPAFAGMLSLLYAGSELVAGHIGMRSHTVWHYWFPAYNPNYSNYSPGLILLLKMAQHAEHFGLASIDLGTGISLYKKRLMNSWIDVAEGSVERPSCLHLMRSTRRLLRSFFRAV